MKKSLLTLFAILLATLANAQISFTPSMKQTAPDEITIYFTGTIGSTGNSRATFASLNLIHMEVI